MWIIIILLNLVHRCNPVPDETCISLIPYTHYVPGSNTFTEELGTEITEIISEFEPFDDCRVFSVVVLCQYRYPACDPTTGTLFPICTELCPTVDSNIQNCALESYDEYPAVGVLFTTFECSEPETYLMNIPPQYISNSSVCTPLSKCMLCTLCVLCVFCVTYSCMCVCVVLYVYVALVYCVTYVSVVCVQLCSW